MKDYKWILRKGSRKDRCPQCGKLRFVPYVLAADPTVKAGPEYGRCDREQSCGYFRYPDRPIDTGAVLVRREPEPKKEPILINADIIRGHSITPGSNNSLYRAYAGLINGVKLKYAMEYYYIGSGLHGETVYPQFDGYYVRTAKAILYGTDGHRIKVEDGGLPVRWLHKSPALRQYTAGRELRQCLFGQHLLNLYPNARVYIVEAEKTAVLMAATDRKQMRERVWLACGGSQMLKGAIDLSPLIGRDVTLIPDDGQYWNWRRTAELHGWRCIDISMLKKHHRLPDGCDIWDCREAKLKGGAKWV